MRRVILAALLTGCGVGTGPTIAIKSIPSEPMIVPSPEPSSDPSPSPTCKPGTKELDATTCIDDLGIGGMGHGVVSGYRYPNAFYGCAYEGRQVCTQQQLKTACDAGLIPSDVMLWSLMTGGNPRSSGTTQVLDAGHCSFTLTDIAVTTARAEWYCCEGKS